MAYRATAITANGTYEIAKVHLKSNVTEYLATITSFGTFGGGTITIQLSPDGGTTKITQDSSPGTPYSATANSTINFRSGGGSDNTSSPILYATLSGATNPSLTIAVDDNAW